MASLPPSLGFQERPSPADSKHHSVSERSLPSEKNTDNHGGSFAFMSNSKYLCYLPAGGEQKPTNLTMTGEDAKNPFSRFSLEPSRKHRKEGLVHIKCCYNNKYWVSHKDTDTESIVVCNANEPQDDISKPSCTLFKHEHTGSNKELISFHYMGKDPVCLGDKERDGWLIVRHGSKDAAAQFMEIDLEKDGTVLPERVCFRGDNGMYLCVVNDKGKLKFSSKDIGDPRAQHTIANNENGTICIRNQYLDKFWRLNKPKSDNSITSLDRLFRNNESSALDFSIYADADPRDKTLHTIFHLTKLHNNATIALYAEDSYGSRRYCKRYTLDDEQHDFLCAPTGGIAKESMLQMYEAVLSRRIYDVFYHVQDARVYDQKTLTTSAVQAVNCSSKQENKAKLTLKYSCTKQATWESSVSTKSALQVTMKVEVPGIVEETVGGLSYEFQYQYEQGASYNWGETNLDTDEQSIEYEITVPPMTKVKLGLVATQGVCEIPFSYMQEDILTNGGRVTARMEDGLFRGVSSYDFRYKVIESLLTKDECDPKKNVERPGL